MPHPETARSGPDTATWLARKIKQGNLRNLPPFRANGGATEFHPDPYARLLLNAIRETSIPPRLAERARDDARAFRSWVEADLLASSATRTT